MPPDPGARPTLQNLLNSRCTGCALPGARLGYFLLHINSMLSDLVEEVGPTGERPLVPRTDGGSACMTDDWASACEAGHATRSMSRKARSPDNARAEGFFGTPRCDFFEGSEYLPR